ETLDIQQEMMTLTLRVVVRALFNLESDSTQQIRTAMNLMMANATGIRMLLPPIARYLPTPQMNRVRRAVKELDEVVYGIVAQHRTANLDSGDLLSMLMSARDEDGSRMSDKQLRDEVLTFLLAGHETTALALTWTWYLLAQHPDAEQKLYQEFNRVLGDRVPEFSDLSRLPYTERVIKESMRLYPPAWSLARTVISDFELRGYKIPAGANVVMSQWIMHRHPAYFPEPEKFDPDRWLTEQAQKLPRFAYFPFGGGPRQCIGSAFAMMEATLLLVTIAQRFRLRTVPEHQVVPVPGFTLRPKYGMRMKLESRTRDHSSTSWTTSSRNSAFSPAECGIWRGPRIPDRKLSLRARFLAPLITARGFGMTGWRPLTVPDTSRDSTFPVSRCMRDTSPDGLDRHR